MDDDELDAAFYDAVLGGIGCTNCEGFCSIEAELSWEEKMTCDEAQRLLAAAEAITGLEVDIPVEMVEHWYLLFAHLREYMGTLAAVVEGCAQAEELGERGEDGYIRFGGDNDE